MAWYALCDATTGQLVSLTTVLPEPVPARYRAVLLADRPDDTAIWDSTTRAFVPRPAPAPTPGQTVADGLLAKAPADWTLRDVAAALRLMLRAERAHYE